MAGREMTAWIAGLSFVSANLGSLELMGWAGSAYQYGILATHWYWVGAIPAMLFLGLVMMPFYYVCKTHSVPGYLNLRYGEHARVLAAISFALEMILMSGVNMFAMAVVMKVVLGWSHHLQHPGLGLRGHALRGPGRVALGHLQRGPAIRAHLGRRAAGAHPGPDSGRRSERAARPRSSPTCTPTATSTSGATPAILPTTPWACTGPASSSAWDSPSASATGPPTSSWCSAFWPRITCAPRAWRRSSAPFSRWRFPSSSSCPACWAWCCCRIPMAAAACW